MEDYGNVMGGCGNGMERSRMEQDRTAKGEERNGAYLARTLLRRLLGIWQVETFRLAVEELLC